VVDAVIESGEPVYGLTTGLGAKVTATLSKNELSEFSYQTLQGRANSLGDPMPADLVRAAMIVRLNSMAIGASGVSPHVAEFLTECINRNLTPVIGERGSIGVSDLCWGATMGLAFVGEGEMSDASGDVGKALDVLGQNNLDPVMLGPKDGLVLANHSSFTVALCAFAVYEATRVLEWLQKAGSMTLYAMHANHSPFDAYVIGLSGNPDFIEAAKQIRIILENKSTSKNFRSEKIQDPLSLRNMVQVHGTLLGSIRIAREFVNAELNASSDNPVIDIQKSRIISSGGYYTSHLTVSLEGISNALSQSAVAQVARLGKLLSHRFSGLPQFLALAQANSNGFAPVMKLAESLLAEIKQLTSPVEHWPSFNAEGVEDIQSNAPLAAQSLRQATNLYRELIAIELMFAAQALDLREDHAMSSKIKEVYKFTRKYVHRLREDRPLDREIRHLSDNLL